MWHGYITLSTVGLQRITALPGIPMQRRQQDVLSFSLAILFFYPHTAPRDALQASTILQTHVADQLPCPDAPPQTPNMHGKKCPICVPQTSNPRHQLPWQASGLVAALVLLFHPMATSPFHKTWQVLNQGRERDDAMPVGELFYTPRR